ILLFLPPRQFNFPTPPPPLPLPYVPLPYPTQTQTATTRPFNPTTFRANAAHPTIRNSLLFIDEETDDVVGVIELEEGKPPKVPPKPERLRQVTPPPTVMAIPESPLHSPPSSPEVPTKEIIAAPPSPGTPKPLSPGAKLAKQVDEHTEKTFPGHNLDISHLSDAITIDSQPSSLDSNGTYIPRTSDPSHNKKEEPTEGDKNRNMRRVEADGTSQMAGDSAGIYLVAPPPAPSASPPRTTHADAWRSSISSTEGGDGFVTASEGGFMTAPSSRRISAASASSSWTELGQRFSRQPSTLSLSPVVAAPTQSSTSAHPTDLSHTSELSEPTPKPSTINHPLGPSSSDAVLLQFLGSGKDSTLRMRRVTGEEIGREG
ncbi:hypothetical protein P7C70_g9594, partial [Phenoliferia sp. Uapishka_3]